jgi:hypothetical protein
MAVDHKKNILVAAPHPLPMLLIIIINPTRRSLPLLLPGHVLICPILERVIYAGQQPQQQQAFLPFKLHPQIHPTLLSSVINRAVAVNGSEQ